jgi:hypothetical protein
MKLAERRGWPIQHVYMKQINLRQSTSRLQSIRARMAGGRTDNPDSLHGKAALIPSIAHWHVHAS